LSFIRGTPVFFSFPLSGKDFFQDHFPKEIRMMSVIRTRPGKGLRHSALIAAAILSLFICIIAFFSSRSGAVAPHVHLTAEEKEWITRHPVIRVAPDPAYEPMEFFSEKGVYLGITAEYLSLIQKRTGLRFQVLRLRNREEIFNAIREGRADLVGAATKTPQRSSFLLFTRPYLEIPLVIVARSKPDPDLTPDQLAGKKVSVVIRHVSEDYLPLTYPRIIPDMVPDIETGLRNVSFGVSEALVDNLLITSFVMRKEGITNLRIVGELAFHYRPSLASRADWPLLNSILEKGLASISSGERETIYKKWVPFESQVMLLTRKTWKTAFAGLGIFALMVAGIIFWNRSLTGQVSRKTLELRKELAERRRVERELLVAHDELERRVGERTTELSEALEALCFTSFAMDKVHMQAHWMSLDFRLIYVNEAACRTLGYSRDELVGMHVWDFDPRISRDECSKMWQTLRETGSYTFESFHRSKCGRIYPVEIQSNYLVYAGKEYNCCFITDISDRKKAEQELREARDELESRVRERTLQLSDLTEELSRAEERERRRIATELHDQVGQMLALSKIRLNSLSRSMPAEMFEGLLDELREYISQSIHEIRSLTFQLSPPLLYEVGLGAALEGLCEEFEEKYAIHATFRGDGKAADLSDDTRIALYQMARELMINVVKHARAKRLAVEMSFISDKLELCIEDDGVGFTLSQSLCRWDKDRSFGLFSIQHRVNHMGGEMFIQSIPDHGSRITISLPLAKE